MDQLNSCQNLRLRQGLSESFTVLWQGAHKAPKPQNGHPPESPQTGAPELGGSSQILPAQDVQWLQVNQKCPGIPHLRGRQRCLWFAFVYLLMLLGERCQRSSEKSICPSVPGDAEGMFVCLSQRMQWGCLSVCPFHGMQTGCLSLCPFHGVQRGCLSVCPSRGIQGGVCLSVRSGGVARRDVFLSVRLDLLAPCAGESGGGDLSVHLSVCLSIALFVRLSVSQSSYRGACPGVPAGAVSIGWRSCRSECGHASYP